MSLTYDVLKDDVRAGRPIDFGFVTYVPERTCRYVRDHMGVAGNWFCRCTECGAEFDERVVDSHFVYCPNCGSMVIGEETDNAD